MILTVFLICGCGSFPVTKVAVDNKNSVENEAIKLLPVLPSKYELSIPPFYIFSDRPIRITESLSKSVSDLRDSVLKVLKIPLPKSVIFVYLFGEKGSFDHYLEKKYPNLPSRRAFFVAQGKTGNRDEDLLVFTWWSDKIELDLRHELTHALIHSSFPSMPLWIDEGLAELFELDLYPSLLRDRAKEALVDFAKVDGPNIKRLEAIKSIHQMGREEYREALCWAHWFLNGDKRARDVFYSFLTDLKIMKESSLHLKISAVFQDCNVKMKEHVGNVMVQSKP
jgi:hypothetical protein